MVADAATRTRYRRRREFMSIHGYSFVECQDKGRLEILLHRGTLRRKDEGLSNEQAFERDMVVFDAVHTVWRDAFKSLKPKHFPYAPPETLKLMIPVKLMVGQVQDESESFL